MANPHFTFSDGHDVVVNGDLALHITPWNMTATAPDGQQISQSGLSVAVLRKQLDGAWKMVIDNPHGGRLLPQK
jgi:ketosteroid isomerase-like protein